MKIGGLPTDRFKKGNCSVTESQIRAVKASLLQLFPEFSQENAAKIALQGSKMLKPDGGEAILLFLAGEAEEVRK